MKQLYRRTIALLHDAEYLLCNAWAHRKVEENDFDSMSSTIRDIWRKTVVNQFHDILPGSCVGVEYEEVNAFYGESDEKLQAIISHLAPKGEKTLNLTPFRTASINPYSTGMPSKEEGALSIKVDDEGQISSVIYKGKELAKGPWNRLMFGEDVPFNWDAWDLEKDSLDNLKPLDVPAKGFVRKGRIGEASSITQRITVHGSRMDFETDIDWHEDHKVLRAEFPTCISAESAIFDIPFGFVARSTKSNTSFETAQFESPAHKFVMLRDESVSVALMSDSKYGYSAKDGLLGITLLKSAKAPDANADMGRHHFVYSVFISDNSLLDTIAQAETLNNPHIKVAEDFSPLVSVSEGLAVETVKMAEKGDEIVFRVREVLGCSNKGSLKIDPCLDGSSLRETDMLEEKSLEISLDFHPFEIKTFRVRRV